MPGTGKQSAPETPAFSAGVSLEPTAGRPSPIAEAGKAVAALIGGILAPLVVVTC